MHELGLGAGKPRYRRTMRNAGLAIIGVLALTQGVRAQPGQTPPTPYGQPAPGPYAPPPHAYGAPAYGQPTVLTPEEHELLLRGEIDDSAQIGGAAVNLFVGFGLGQAIQGRWSDTGWIFTLGELGSMAVLMGAAIDAIDDCGNHDQCADTDENVGLMVGAALAFTVFRVWSVGDAIAGPSAHNRRVRDIKMRVGIPVRLGELRPYVRRSGDGGGTAGLSLHF